MDDKRTFEAAVTYEDGDWLIEVVAEPRIHSYGRTIEAARRHLVDAAALWHELDPESVDIEIVELRGLDPDVVEAVARAAELRAKAEEAQATSVVVLGEAANLLGGAAISLRDSASLLGVSFQRVHQLRDHAARPHDTIRA